MCKSHRDVGQHLNMSQIWGPSLTAATWCVELEARPNIVTHACGSLTWGEKTVLHYSLSTKAHFMPSLCQRTTNEKGAGFEKNIKPNPQSCLQQEYWVVELDAKPIILIQAVLALLKVWNQLQSTLIASSHHISCPHCVKESLRKGPVSYLRTRGQIWGANLWSKKGNSRWIKANNNRYTGPWVAHWGH